MKQDPFLCEVEQEFAPPPLKSFHSQLSLPIIMRPIDENLRGITRLLYGGPKIS